MEWQASFLNDTDVLVVGDLVSAVLATPLDLEQYTSPTLVRTRGLLVVSAAGGLAVGQAFGAFGLAVVDLDPTGSTAPVLDPLSNADYDWYYHTYFNVTGIGATADDPLGWGSVQRTEIDSRAQRKIEQGEGLMAFFANDLLSDFSVSLWFGTRSLMKE